MTTKISTNVLRKVEAKDQLLRNWKRFVFLLQNFKCKTNSKADTGIWNVTG